MACPLGSSRDHARLSSIHGIPGVVGSIYVGIAANPDYYDSIPDGGGIIWGSGGTLLGYQVLAVTVVALYAAVITAAIMTTLEKLDSVEGEHIVSRESMHNFEG